MTEMTIDTIFRGKRGAISYVPIFVALTVFFLFISGYSIHIYDEGLILTGAFRVLNGDIPSRDFYVVYGPGQFYVLAGLFKIFGTNVLVARIYDSAIVSCIIFIAYLFLSRFHPRWYSLCGSICIIAVLTKYQLDLYPINPVLVISLASASILVTLLFRDSSALHYLPISIGIALILLFRYDVAIISFAAFVFPIILLKVIKLRVSKLSFCELSRQTIHIFLVLTIAPLIAIILFTVAGIFMPALQDIIKYDSTNYVEMRSLPFPGIETLKVSPLKFISVYFPLFASVFAVFTIILVFRPIDKLRNYDSTERLIPIIVFTSLTCFFFVKGWVLATGYQMLLANIPAVLLCFMCAYQLSCFWLCTEKIKMSLTGRAFQAGVWMFSLCFLNYMLKVNVDSNPLYLHRAALEVHKELPSLSIFRIGPNQLELALYVKNNTDVNERIHSATGRHDKIFVNDASLYFVAQRMPASKWHHYEPGMQNSENVQREIISDLERNEVSLIMRDSSFDDVRQPNKSAASSNVFVLDQYLEKYFHKEISFGKKIAVYLKN